MKKAPFSGMVLLLAAAWLGGCASLPQEGNDSEPVLSQLAVSSYMGGSDPLEGFNRTVFYGVDFFLYYVYRPIGYVYGSIIPRPGVNMINNATDNLEFPRRFISSLLQAKFQGAGCEFLRFLTNSTIGIAGLFDPATHWFEIPRSDEDFGQAFAAWGIPPGCVLQLATSSNIRDGVGMALDYAVDIKSYFYGGQAFTFLNRGMDSFDLYDTVRQSNFDSYQALKDYRLLMRYLALTDWQSDPLFVDLDENGEVANKKVRGTEDGEKIIPLADFYSQSPAVDTLRSAWLQPRRDSLWTRLSLFNHDFPNSARTGSVEINSGKSISYRYFLTEKQDAPLVIVLPGLGGHNTAAMALALAELCVKNELNVLIVSNTMNWEFADIFDSPPGFTPDDAVKLEMVLEKVLLDLIARETEYSFDKKMLLGYSQGALNALFLMDRQYKEQGKLDIARAVAINPPVDLMKSLLQLDNFLRSMDEYRLDQAIPMLTKGIGSYVYFARKPAFVRRPGMAHEKKSAEEENQTVEFIDQVPVTDQAARMLIAYSFKRTLDDLLVTLHHKKPVNGIAAPYEWGNRQQLYDELAQWNYLLYCQNVLSHYYMQQQESMTLLDLNQKAGLRAIEKSLRAMPQISVFHSANDFLLDAEDRKFLRDVLQDKLTVFDHGGHLGNLYRDDVQQKIIQKLIAE